MKQILLICISLLISRPLFAFDIDGDSIFPGVREELALLSAVFLFCLIIFFIITANKNKNDKKLHEWEKWEIWHKDKEDDSKTINKQK